MRHEPSEFSGRREPRAPRLREFLGIAGFCFAFAAACSGSKLAPAEHPPSQPTDTERLQSLELENRRLTDRLAEMTAERDSLKAGRAPATPCEGGSEQPASAGSVAVSEGASSVPVEPPRIAIVVEGEEPGKVVEVRGDEPRTEISEAKTAPKKKPASSKPIPPQQSPAPDSRNGKQ